MLVQSYPSVRRQWQAVLPACQRMYLHTSVHPVQTDMNGRRYNIMYCTYCNVFSAVNETALLSLCSVCARSCVLKEAWLWRLICREGGSYAFKISLLSLASPKSPTLPFMSIVHKVIFFVYLDNL